MEFGTTGLKRTGGQVFEEFLPELSGTQAIKVFTEMAENDSVVSATLWSFEMFVRQVDWYWEPPADPTPQEQEATDFANTCLLDMSHTFQDFLSEALSMLDYGWSAFEIVYKQRKGPNKDPKKNSLYNDNRVGWRKFAIRSQDSLDEWQFDDGGGVAGIVQSAPPDYDVVEIPIDKLLLFRTRSRKNNPEGRSVLRGAYRAWYYKKQIETLEGIGLERDLSGVACAKIPFEWMGEDATAPQKAAYEEFKRIVTALRRDEMDGLVLPKILDPSGRDLIEFELLTTGGTRQHDTDKIIQRWDQRIAQSVLADFIVLGHNQRGSFALASSKTNVFSLGVNAILDTIAETINRHATPKLFSFNTFNIERLPRLRHGDIETPELRDLGNYILRLATAGIDLTDEETTRYLRRVANLPESSAEPEDDDGSTDDDSSDDDEGIEDPMLANRVKQYEKFRSIEDFINAMDGRQPTAAR
jgi:hypothetical protein